MDHQQVKINHNNESYNQHENDSELPHAVNNFRKDDYR